MLQDHVELILPPEETAIWRYMKVEDFIALLLNKSLWFSRSDQFEDRWEGHYSPPTLEAITELFQGDPKEIRDLIDFQRGLNYEARKTIYINCWHCSEHESVALWKIYGAFGKAVAIKSSIVRLRKALATTTNDIHAGRVSYADFETTKMSISNLFTPFTHKRQAFRFEDELRLFHWDHSKMGAPSNLPDSKRPLGDATALGVPVSVDVGALIDRVFLSPKAEPHVVEGMTMLANKLGLVNCKVQRSTLFDEPWSTTT